jgi:hypothetical protein
MSNIFLRFSFRRAAAALVIAGTAMSATALAPSAAAAKGFFMPVHFGHHWGHGWSHGYWGYSGCWPHKYINAYGEVVIVSGCDY